MDEQAWQQKSAEILTNIKEWRRTHPKATFVEIEKAYPKTHVIGIPGRVPYQPLKNSTNTGARTSGAVIATEWS